MIAPKIVPAVQTPQKKARRARRSAAPSRFVLALVVVAVTSTVAVAYTACCAVATKQGYSRTEMYTQFRQVQAENQLLAAEARRLEGPERLATAAVKSGMELKRQAFYLGQTAQAAALKAKLENKIASNLSSNP